MPRHDDYLPQVKYRNGRSWITYAIWGAVLGTGFSLIVWAFTFFWQRNQEHFRAVKDVVLIDSSVQINGPIVTGLIENKGPTLRRYVSVKIILMDNTRAQIGHAEAAMSGLEPWGRWRFTALGTTRDAVAWKLAHIESR